LRGFAIIAKFLIQCQTTPTVPRKPQTFEELQQLGHLFNLGLISCDTWVPSFETTALRSASHSVMIIAFWLAIVAPDSCTQASNSCNIVTNLKTKQWISLFPCIVALL
jgi:hypothetical protein